MAEVGQAPHQGGGGLAGLADGAETAGQGAAFDARQGEQVIAVPVDGREEVVEVVAESVRQAPQGLHLGAGIAGGRLLDSRRESEVEGQGGGVVEQGALEEHPGRGGRSVLADEVGAEVRLADLARDAGIEGRLQRRAQFGREQVHHRDAAQLLAGIPQVFQGGGIGHGHPAARGQQDAHRDRIEEIAVAPGLARDPQHGLAQGPGQHLGGGRLAGQAGGGPFGGQRQGRLLGGGGDQRHDGDARRHGAHPAEGVQPLGIGDVGQGQIEEHGLEGRIRHVPQEPLDGRQAMGGRHVEIAPSAQERGGYSRPIFGDQDLPGGGFGHASPPSPAGRTPPGRP